MVSEHHLSNENFIPMSSTNQPTSSPELSLVVFNITTQINEKLTPSSFPQWRAQFEALLIGYDLLNYVNGESQCPPSDGTPQSVAKKNRWVRQDKLILSAILASTSPSITPLIAITKTSHEAWKKLSTLYASKSRTRAMQLKEELTLIQRGNQPISEYLHTVKSLADEIALIDHPISDDDLTLYVLHGLGPEFREIAAPIRAREKSLAFEELHDMLVGHESYLRRLEAATQQLVAAANFTSHRFANKETVSSASQQNRGSNRGNVFFRQPGQNRSSNSSFRDRQRNNNNSGRPNPNRRFQQKCQYCDQLGHTAKICPKLQSSTMSVNCAASSDTQDNKWLIDSAASHNITGDLQNLSVHSEYDGTDEVLLGDGTGLAVTHIGSLALPTPTKTFHLHDTLCVPHIHKNLISIHHFTKHNNVFLELHPFFFLVKDKTTGAILLRGACENGVYMFPDSLVASPTPKKKLLMCMNELHLMGGTNDLDTLPLKLFNILSINYPFLFQQKKFHLYVLPVPQIKRINNLLDQQVSKVTLHLTLYTLMFGVLLTLLGFVVHGIIFFSWTIIPNICGSIQCLQNHRCLVSFPNSKCWWKKDFNPPSKLCTQIMVVNF
jgi:hypothetical protein